MSFTRKSCNSGRLSVKRPPGCEAILLADILVPRFECHRNHIATLIFRIFVICILAFSQPFIPAGLMLYFACCRTPPYCLVTAVKHRKHTIYHHLGYVLWIMWPSGQPSQIMRFQACLQGTKTLQHWPQGNKSHNEISPTSTETQHLRQFGFCNTSNTTYLIS